MSSLQCGIFISRYTFVFLYDIQINSKLNLDMNIYIYMYIFLNYIYTLYSSYLFTIDFVSLFMFTLSSPPTICFWLFAITPTIKFIQAIKC